MKQTFMYLVFIIITIFCVMGSCILLLFLLFPSMAPFLQQAAIPAVYWYIPAGIRRASSWRYKLYVLHKAHIGPLRESIVVS